ncbi:MAG: divergent PAP2 family protein [Defluviitaleaceae bacterium]|nr:divergent PAP2 family protein [Defluviitaleaceae bacterium]
MPDGFAELAANRHLITGIVGLVLAQILKIPYDLWRTKTFSLTMLTSTGGMPSSHSAFVVALMLSIGFYEGFGTPIFAVSAALAMVVMHDAAGVRRAAGLHAEAINFLYAKLQKHGIQPNHKLKEMLGHQPLEVLGGAILGIIVSVAAIHFFPFAGV